MLEKTWRWFGPNDKISLDYLVQMGVEGVVTALHHLPIGVVWTKDEINKLKNQIEAKGLRWSVVESLPVSEDIKTKGKNYKQHIENYKISLKNLGECGVDTVCYNFMPVLDWTRTELNYTHKGGGKGLYFHFPTFVAFDVFILKRENAANDYPAEIVKEAEEIYKKMSQKEMDDLVYVIIVLTQGFVNGVIDGTVKDPKKSFWTIFPLIKTSAGSSCSKISKISLMKWFPFARSITSTFAFTLTTRRILFWVCREFWAVPTTSAGSETPTSLSATV